MLLPLLAMSSLHWPWQHASCCIDDCCRKRESVGSTYEEPSFESPSPQLPHTPCLANLEEVPEPEEKQCKRYAYVRINLEGGVGHRFSDLVFGYIFALENNCTFILDGSVVRDGERVDRKYPWLVQFLGLSNIPTLESVAVEGTLRREVVQNWDVAGEFADLCDIILETCDTCCPDVSLPAINGTGWCFLSKFGAFNLAKSYFRKLYRPSDYAPAFDVYNSSVANREIVVAWHMRTGDISPVVNKAFYSILSKSSSEMYFANVFNQLNTIFEGRKLQLYVFSEGPLDGFELLNKYSPVYVDYLDVPDTLYHFIKADVLVCSGSSFPIVGALYSTNIVLQSKPKEGVRGIYELAEHAILDDNGIIVRPELEVLTHRAKAISKRILNRQQ